MSEHRENPFDKKIEFEAIDSPERLAEFMQENIHYGFVGKNKKIYDPSDPTFREDFQSEYSLQRPDELVESGRGVCWDTVELERTWLLRHGYSPETYFMMFAQHGGTDLPTHTFIVFRRGEKYVWFEHAFADHAGLHEYDDLETLIEDVRKKHFAYAQKHRGALPEDAQRLRITRYDQPPYGQSANDFVATIIEHAPALIAEE